MSSTPEVIRTLAAILMADVVGYSRLMQQDEEGTVAALEGCRTIFSEQITAHRERIVNGPGDRSGSAFVGQAPAGTFKGTTFYWDEVGAIRLRASVADADYLGGVLATRAGAARRSLTSQQGPEGRLSASRLRRKSGRSPG